MNMLVKSITAYVKSGPNKGLLLTPHKRKDGKYAYYWKKKEPVQLAETLEELAQAAEAGNKLRMSNEVSGIPASGISPSSLLIEYFDDDTVDIAKELLLLIGEQDNLDSETVSKNRKEQKLLRSLLLSSSDIGKCAICGGLFPAELLVAAHIKKRAMCTLEERQDIENVAELMCKLGCDDLFEKGYIVVEGDVVVVNGEKSATEAVEKYVSALAGNNVSSRDKSKSYYSWHARHHRNDDQSAS